jgi:hypothetical protein
VGPRLKQPRQVTVGLHCWCPGASGVPLPRLGEEERGWPLTWGRGAETGLRGLGLVWAKLLLTYAEGMGKASVLPEPGLRVLWPTCPCPWCLASVAWVCSMAGLSVPDSQRVGDIWVQVGSDCSS